MASVEIMGGQRERAAQRGELNLYLLFRLFEVEEAQRTTAAVCKPLVVMRGASHGHFDLVLSFVPTYIELICYP